MSKSIDTSEVEILADLGDAALETRQQSPIPPYYQDSIFGLGIRPS
jgi:hypothetical protein